MSNKNKSRLSREIVGRMMAAAAVAVFIFVFIEVAGHSIALNYIDMKGLNYSDDDIYYLQLWITAISLVAAVIVFVGLFMFFLGQKLKYLNNIISGIDALRTHRMDYTLPIEGTNEFTDLAHAINYLSETERYLKQKERRMSEEREAFIRSLSHDIRTPLTSMIAYSQLVSEKGTLSDEEVVGYADMMQKKSLRIKNLTDRLLENADKTGEEIQSGRMLMQQLAEEWAAELEDEFNCVLDYDDCPEFSGTLDVADFQRIFDNLASNVKKYAEPSADVKLRIFREEDMLVIKQSNANAKLSAEVESHKLGLINVRSIAEEYGGTTEILKDKNKYCIKIFISLEFFRIS